MGRIKTVPIKRITHELIKLHRDRFTDNYEGLIKQLSTR